MVKAANDFLSGIKMTMLGGISLIISLAITWNNFSLKIDPAWLAVLICGIPLMYLAIYRVINNDGISKISSALLITIAMMAAIAIGDLFAAGEVAFIMAIGAIIEEKTTNRAKKGLQNLISLTPQQGRIIVNGEEKIVPTDSILAGDVLRILPGEKIAADGKIIRGNTSVDQSIMTGESLPADKTVGDEVFCGTINRFGSIEIKVTKAGSDSSLQKLINMVKDAENKKAPMQRIADKWASYLVPVALMIAVAAYFVTGDIVKAVTILVVFCPCALVLATPTAIMAAIGQATKHGAIIKSGEALETMGKVDTIAFDKTGTLTFGKLAVTDIVTFSRDIDKETLLTFAYSAEIFSEHPLAKAISDYAKKQDIAPKKVNNFRMYPGKGISAEIDGKKILCGNEKYLLENGVSLSSQSTEILTQLSSQGKAFVLVATDQIIVGVVALSDVLRPNAQTVIDKLKNMQVQPLLLTGDNKKTANYFARKVGVAKIYAQLLPEEKVANIANLKQSNHVVCMIGDGVNDAPALKSADVGVSMGSMGSDIAVDASDIALMSDDISKIPYLKRLSDATVQTIKFSISLSLCINFAAILLSLQGMLTPTTGALVHNAGSCLVVLIAALLYDRNFEET